MTPRELIRSWASCFEATGIPDPAVDAAALLSSLTGTDALRLRLDTDSQISGGVLEAMRILAERRLEREPLQYLLGSQSFMGHEFRVTPEVLIPRPETELLCEKAIALLEGFPRPRSALDLCCGSGCIGLSVSLAVPEARVVCTDLSPGALDVCRENAARLGADAECLQGDLFAPVSGRFSLIVSNPPYIPAAECSCLQPEVMREPRCALDGGEDGLDFYRRIAAEAPAHLIPGGALLLEIGCPQGEAVTALLHRAGFRRISVEQDYGGLDRIVTAFMPGGWDEGAV